VADGMLRLAVYSDRDELDQTAFEIRLSWADHAERTVLSVDEFHCGRDDPSQHAGQAQVRGQGDHGVEKACRPIRRAHDAKSTEGLDAWGPRRLMPAGRLVAGVALLPLEAVAGPGREWHGRSGRMALASRHPRESS
jgi:hypothetical protein